MVWNQTLEEQLDRPTAIQEGVVPVRDQDEMLDLFVKLTNQAESTVHAVDQTSLERWFTDSRLRRYLEAQLERAQTGQVRVVRLRVVRAADLADARQRNLLREFITLHNDAGAQLVLSHEDDLRGLNTSFLRGRNPEDRLILAMIDYSTRPACLVGELDEDGYVKTSVLYLRSLAQVRRYYADLQSVLEDTAYRAARRSNFVGGTCVANAASRGGTLRPTMAVRPVAKSEVDAGGQPLGAAAWPQKLRA
jgi:hypothetical protein